MKILKIISTHKRKLKNKPVERWTPPRRGQKRVMAIVEDGGLIQTRHIDVPA